MASDYTIRFRQFLPGAGFDSAGNAKQGKTRIVGSCSVTAYSRGGEALAPQDVGLTVIDSIHLRIEDEVHDLSGAGADEGRRTVLYNQTQDQFYLCMITNAGVVTEDTQGATQTVEFDVFGDSAHDVELT